MKRRVREYLADHGLVAVDRRVMEYFAGRDCDEKGNHVVYDTATDTYQPMRTISPDLRRA